MRPKMKLREWLLLVLPCLFLLGIGFLRSAKPVLRLKSVKVKPGADVSGRTQGIVAVEVFTEYHNPPILDRFGEGGFYISRQHGVCIEDAKGTKYGTSSTAVDRKKFHPFRNSAGPYGVRAEGIDDPDKIPYAVRFIFPIDQIPKSAGKLTLKTVLTMKLDSSEASERLPLSIVVRQ